MRDGGDGGFRSRGMERRWETMLAGQVRVWFLLLRPEPIPQGGDRRAFPHCTILIFPISRCQQTGTELRISASAGRVCSRTCRSPRWGRTWPICPERVRLSGRWPLTFNTRRRRRALRGRGAVARGPRAPRSRLAGAGPSWGVSMMAGFSAWQDHAESRGGYRDGAKDGGPRQRADDGAPRPAARAGQEEGGRPAARALSEAGIGVSGGARSSRKRAPKCQNLVNPKFHGSAHWDRVGNGGSGAHWTRFLSSHGTAGGRAGC